MIGRFTLPGLERDKRPWQKVGEALAGKFVLPKTDEIAGHIAIAGTIDVAQQFHAAGLRTLYLGAGEDLPAGVRHGWRLGVSRAALGK